MKKTKKARIPLFLVRIYDNLSLLLRFFSRRYRLTGTHKFQEPFFIVGSGRSGNTLLRSMLVAGGQIAIQNINMSTPMSKFKCEEMSFFVDEKPGSNS